MTPNRQLIKMPYQALSPNEPFRMGDIVGGNAPFLLTPDQLAVHMAVLGGSGTGKSKFIELLLRQYMLDSKGFCFVDPHGDTAASLLAFAAGLNAHGKKDVWRKVHYLDLTPQCVFAYDPVSRAPRISEVGRYAYYQWMKTRVDRLCRNILRRVMEADQEVMVRLKRWLRCMLWACLVALDDNNTHVGLDKALIFTDPKDDEFIRLFRRVAPHLPKRVRRNFEKLIETRRAQDQEKWVESTINRLEDILSPLTEAMFSQAALSIDIPRIIANRDFLIVNVKQTNYFSHDEKVNIGGLLIDEVLVAKEAEEELPEDERVEFALVIDEVGEFLGDDLKRALGASRKYKNPLILCGQDLSTFAKGDFDMAAKVLSMCGTVICFQNTFQDDKEILIDRVGTGNLNFDPKLVEVQRQRRLIKVMTEDRSHSLGGNKTVTSGWDVSHNASYAHMVGQALTDTSNWSKNSSDGFGTGQGVDFSQAEIEKDGEIVSKGKHKGIRKNQNRTHTEGEGKGGGSSIANNTADTRTVGQAVGKSGSDAEGTNWGSGIVKKESLIPHIETEWEENGQLEAGPIADQKEKMKQQLHLLGVGNAIVACRFWDRAFVARIREVKEWWSNGRDKWEAIRRIKEALHKLRPYHFDPRTVSDLELSAHDDDDGLDEGATDARKGGRPQSFLDPPVGKEDPFQ